MKNTSRQHPHSIKRWHLESFGLDSGDTERSLRDPSSLGQLTTNRTRFSAWTPIASKSFNKQLFHERVNLIGHWFELWTDKQRKHFLYSILTKSTKSQLKFVQDWFAEEGPVSKLDFTTVLPRFISLYIFSFLSPHDLCSIAQVSWHWRVLSEQDCLWMPKCTKFGWYLPYSPSDNEYGAWKRHYISCACTLDYLTPREAAETYGTLNEPKERKEEEEEKLCENVRRKFLQERLALHKRELFKTRPPWMSGQWRSGAVNTEILNECKSLTDRAALQAALCLIKDQTIVSSKTLSSQLIEKNNQTTNFRLEKSVVENSLKLYPKRPHDTTVPIIKNSNLHHHHAHKGSSSPTRLLLISSNIPAYEVVLASVKPAVIPLVYDFDGMTIESLLLLVENALNGSVTQSIGIITGGDSQNLHLLQNCKISSENILRPEVRDFWEKLGSCVESEKKIGHIDLFVPLAASESGMEILDCLTQLSGVNVCCPSGISTGSYQHILSEWLTGFIKNGLPPYLYFDEMKLQAWCRLADIMEEALRMVRRQMKLYISEMQRNVSGRIIGQFMYDTMAMAIVQSNQKVAEALTDGLLELANGKSDNPLEFLSLFLLKKSNKNKEIEDWSLKTERNTLPKSLKLEDLSLRDISSDRTTGSPRKMEVKFKQLNMLENKLLADLGDQRTRFAREILRSEREYVRILEVIKDVYFVPLKASLSSNRAILSISNIQIIFSDILDILKINNHLLGEITERFQEWGPAQCLGDVFMKFGLQLMSYTNFFNNYSVILKTIDKCREAIPTFRAFLKRHNQTVVTQMMSLQELLLFPSTRFEQYVSLLYAFRLHTAPEHEDRKDLTTAISQLKKYKDYIGQLKAGFEKDTSMSSIQKSIDGCPNLAEANRHLIKIQDVVQLNCANEEISVSLRIYEPVHDLRIFLFNDALVITSCHIAYTPFQRATKTSLRFMASVSLTRLLVEDIPDTKYSTNVTGMQYKKTK
uniref:Epithelial cell transforming 2 like n=1 Tax=Leptobrachium leishanense TaxID=445787 RepID=A0A8C5QB53_9ANUR